MKKEDPRKKKKLPFYGRAYGGAARARADRKAYKKGGAVSKADAELISPTEPHAPAGGKVEQKFKKGGIAKRAAGGATAKRLEAPEDDSRAQPVGDVIAPPPHLAFPSGEQRGRPTQDESAEGRMQSLPRIFANPMRRDRGAPLYPGSFPPGPRGFKKGGVAKRADGGDSDPTKPPRSSSVPDLASAGLNPLLPPLTAGGLGIPGLDSGSPGGSMPTAPTGPPPGPLLGPGGDAGPSMGGRLQRGGSVMKRAAGGRLTAAQRQSLPKSDFALPGQGTGPKGAGSGSYPIPDEKHARLALARSSGKPVASTVRAKVKAKYPDMGS